MTQLLWQYPESAPKDRRVLLGWYTGQVHIGQLVDGEHWEIEAAVRPGQIPPQMRVEDPPDVWALLPCPNAD